ncbi:hypothetical protein GCM10009665_46800 [Kitasatospora nipponensis]|uniref:4'-phosphopantetheinyl transferase superfamily protein n=1 Tax=Kitasatospora nipponensis TaxID=258049 RepID=A0ABN1WHP5_9ACTN
MTAPATVDPAAPADLTGAPDPADGGRVLLFAGSTPRLPRDAFGRRVSPSGRALLLAGARRAGGGPDAPSAPHGPLTRGADRRWYWAGTDWRGSASHVGELGVAALTRGGGWIGVDLQDERPRPAALGWLARVLERPAEQVGFAEWAETEALLKARGIAHHRPTRLALPPWRPGWRPTADGWWLRSGRLTPGGPHLAIAAERPLSLLRLSAPAADPSVDPAADRAVDPVRTEGTPQ